MSAQPIDSSVPVLPRRLERRAAAVLRGEATTVDVREAVVTPLRRLRTVPTHRRQPGRLRTVPFAVVLVGVLGIGMIAVLLLSIALEAQSFQLKELDATNTRLSYQEAGLRAGLEDAQSTATLTEKASELGMRPNTSTAFLDLRTGKVLGKPDASKGVDVPAAVVQDPLEQRAERSAQARAEAVARQRDAGGALQKLRAELQRRDAPRGPAGVDARVGENQRQAQPATQEETR